MKSTHLTSVLALGATLLTSGWTAADCSNRNANIQVIKPDSIYADHLDGTVTDTQTGLMWQKCSLGQTWVDNTADNTADDQCTGGASAVNWQLALDAAQTANAGSALGYGDWRLPNKNELASLVEPACVNPSINDAVFVSTPANWYWSSSALANDSRGAWLVVFNDGLVNGGGKYLNSHVRLVRGGQ